MNIVMLDSGQLTGEADFPDVNINKYGWQQFVSLEANEVEERCWRTDVIISTSTPITAQVIQQSFKLKLIIAAGDNTGHIDQTAASEHNIQVMNIAGITGDTPENTLIICDQVVQHINTWLETLTEKD